MSNQFEIPVAESPTVLDGATRLASLASYRIMGSESESAFDDVACLAATLCNTSAAFVTFVDANHQFFKASVGAGGVREAVMESGFCPFTVALGDVLIIPDTLANPLYADNPAVRDAGVRFYAGVPVRDPVGRVLGTVCVVDQKPHQISDWNGVRR